MITPFNADEHLNLNSYFTFFMSPIFTTRFFADVPWEGCWGKLTNDALENKSAYIVGVIV